MHTDVLFTDVHTDVVFADVQMCFGPIRSCDHDENNVHTRVPVYPKFKMAAIKLQFASLYSQICTNVAGIWYIHVKQRVLKWKFGSIHLIWRWQGITVSINQDFNLCLWSGWLPAMEDQGVENEGLAHLYGSKWAQINTVCTWDIPLWRSGLDNSIYLVKGF